MVKVENWSKDSDGAMWVGQPRIAERVVRDVWRRGAQHIFVTRFDPIFSKTSRRPRFFEYWELVVARPVGGSRLSFMRWVHFETAHDKRRFLIQYSRIPMISAHFGNGAHFGTMSFVKTSFHRSVRNGSAWN
jgi:hypothetical protein